MVALLGIGLFLLGLLLMTISGIWGLILAFQESVVWGLLYLFIPFAALIFLIQKWSKQAVRNSFFLWLIGLLVTAGGSFASVLGRQTLVEQLQVDIETDIDTGSPDALPSDSTTPIPNTQPIESNTSDPTETNQNSSPASPTTDISSPAPTPNNGVPDYHQTMMIGYAAYNQGDYQTALINFRRALEIEPGNRLAAEAVQNTEAIIQQQR